MNKLVLLFFTLLLTACVTTKEPPTLSLEELEKFRIETVNVDIDERVRWYGGQQEYAASVGCKMPETAVNQEDRIEQKQKNEIESDCDYTSTVESPEALDYIHAEISKLMFEAINDVYANTFEGPVPVTLNVSIHNLYIVGAGQSILIGGFHRLDGSIELKDEKTGKVVIAPTFFSVSVNGNGLIGAIATAVLDPIPGHLSELFADKSHAWLMHKPVS